MERGLKTIADTDHWPESKAGSISSWVPPLLTHFNIFNFHLNKAAGIRDAMVTQGLDVQGRGPMGVPVLVEELLLLHARKPTAVPKLVGNGINPMVLLCVKLLFMSNVRRKRAATPTAPLTSADDSTTEGEDLDELEYRKQMDGEMGVQHSVSEDDEDDTDAKPQQTETTVGTIEDFVMGLRLAEGIEGINELKELDDEF